MRTVMLMLALSAIMLPTSKGGERLPSVYPEVRESFSDDMASALKKNKACSGVRVTASKSDADYIAHTGVWTFAYTVHKPGGEIIATGQTQRMSTLAKKICEAIKRDSHAGTP